MHDGLASELLREVKASAKRWFIIDIGMSKCYHINALKIPPRNYRPHFYYCRLRLAIIFIKKL